MDYVLSKNIGNGLVGKLCNVHSAPMRKYAVVLLASLIRIIWLPITLTLGVFGSVCALPRPRTFLRFTKSIILDLATGIVEIILPIAWVRYYKRVSYFPSSEPKPSISFPSKPTKSPFKATPSNTSAAAPSTPKRVSYFPSSEPKPSIRLQSKPSKSPSKSTPSTPPPIKSKKAIELKCWVEKIPKDVSKLMTLASSLLKKQEFEKATWLLTLLPKETALTICDSHISSSSKEKPEDHYLKWLKSWIQVRPETQSINKESLDLFALELGFGYKSANLMVMTGQLTAISSQLKSCKVAVPSFVPISHQQTWLFLLKHIPNLNQLWEDFLNTFDNSKRAVFHRASTTDEAKKANLQISTEGEVLLTKIREQITKAYASSDGFYSPLIMAWLKENSSEYVIIRSTGKEDSDTNANAGGNDSIPFVKTEMQEISIAMGQVIASYFGTKSLIQRIQNGDRSIFNEPPFLPVLVQTIIAEKENSTTRMPTTRSGVLFTREHDKADLLTINAAFGHNEGVVTSQVAVDTYYCAKGSYFEAIQKKPSRSKQRSSQGRVTIELVPNDLAAQMMPALTRSMVSDLNTAATALGKLYGDAGAIKPMDMEYTILAEPGKPPIIYLLQIRPLAKLVSHAPSYLEFSSDMADQSIKMAIFQTGSPAVRTLTDPTTQVIIASDLPEALVKYQSHSNAGDIQLVVIQKTAPMTSHEAVTFRPTGLPIFLISADKERSKIEEFIYNSSMENPLKICPQKGVIIKPDALLHEKSGLITYPAQFTASINPPPFARSRFSFAHLKNKQEKIQVQDTLLKQIVCQAFKWRQEAHLTFSDHRQQKGRIRTLFEVLATETDLQKNQEALGELFIYLAHFCSQSRSQLQGETLDLYFDLLYRAYNLTRSLAAFFEKTDATSQMNRLFYLKQLETLIFQPIQKGLVAGASFATLIQESKNSNAQLAKAFGLSSTPENNYLVYLRSLIYSESIQNEWIAYIKQQIKSPPLLLDLIQTVKTLSSRGLIQMWLNTIFPSIESKTTSSQKSIKEIEQFDAIERNLEEIESSQEQWSHPLYVEKHLDKMVSEIKRLCDCLKNAYIDKKPNAFIKQSSLLYLRRLLTACDTAIKSLTGSSEFLDKKSQAKAFHTFVVGYLSILMSCMKLAQSKESALMAVSIGSPVSFDAYVKKLLSGTNYKFGFDNSYSSPGLNERYEPQRVARSFSG